MQWREAGVAPQVVFEVLSPGNRAGEMKRKLEFYERYGVEEYYLYDPEPLTASLVGYIRSADHLEPIAEMAGWTSPRLGVRFGLSGSSLLLVGPDGRPFRSYKDVTREVNSLDRRNSALTDLVDATARQLDATARQLDEAARQREAERERAERLAARLRELGIDPGA